jgi:HEAT repeat protein
VHLARASAAVVAGLALAGAVAFAARLAVRRAAAPVPSPPPAAEAAVAPAPPGRARAASPQPAAAPARPRRAPNLETVQRDYAARPPGDGPQGEAALAAAARLGTPEAVRWLAAVAARDARLGARAGAALGTVRSRAAVPALTEVALADGPALVRGNAAKALGAVGGADEARALAGLAHDPRQPHRVRQEAARAAGRIGSAEAAEELATALDDLAAEGAAGDEGLRLALVEALAGIRAPVAREARARHGARPLSPVERAFVARALGPSAARR